MIIAQVIAAVSLGVRRNLTYLGVARECRYALGVQVPPCMRAKGSAHGSMRAMSDMCIVCMCCLHHLLHQPSVTALLSFVQVPVRLQPHLRWRLCRRVLLVQMVRLLFWTHRQGALQEVHSNPNLAPAGQLSTQQCAVRQLVQPPPVS